MDAEFLELARVVILALQLLISGGGLFAILVGLKRMGEAGGRRDREIDVLGQALERQGDAMTQAFTQQGEALAKIGQALERQGDAMTQAFTQQGRALETLIERTAPR